MVKASTTNRLLAPTVLLRAVAIIFCVAVANAVGQTTSSKLVPAALPPELRATLASRRLALGIRGLLVVSVARDRDRGKAKDRDDPEKSRTSPHPRARFTPEIQALHDSPFLILAYELAGKQATCRLVQPADSDAIRAHP